MPRRAQLRASPAQAIAAVPDRGRTFGRCAWRQADRGLAPSVAKHPGACRGRRRAHGKQGCPSLFPLARTRRDEPACIFWPACRSLWRRLRADGASALAFQPDVARHPRQSRIHPSGRKAGARPRAHHPHHRLCLPERLGLAALAGTQAMRRYIDHVLAILPFEPEALRRLGGPACSYVGHPLVEKLDWIGTLDAEPLRTRLGIPQDRSVLLVLPGSRASESTPHGTVWGCLARVAAEGSGPSTSSCPSVDSVRALVEAKLALGRHPASRHATKLTSSVPSSSPRPPLPPQAP